MMSSKHGYSHTHIIEKGESVKMSNWSEMYSDEEEERMVAQVGGRTRSLVQALRRERERAGRALPNSQITQDVQIRPGRQEVGPPHGWEVERRPGGLQAWGRRNQNNNNALGTTNTQDSQWTTPQERPRTRVRARARPGTTLPHPDLPIIPILLLWGT